ncbi:MAG: LPS export ABC transporter periplasmic protein LptC [Gammaproteobacteria bacterium]
MKLIAALVFVLLAASAATFLITGLEHDTGEQAMRSSSPLDEAYDYYVQDMHATRFAADGRAISQLRAGRVTHFPDGDRAELQAPAFTSFDGEAWQVSAATGTLVPDAQRNEDRLELEGKVELRKPLTQGDFIELSTSALTVYVASEEASSEVPVELRMRGSRLNGSGMQARLAENYINLNDSHGTHEPATRP